MLTIPSDGCFGRKSEKDSDYIFYKCYSRLPDARVKISRKLARVEKTALQV